MGLHMRWRTERFPGDGSIYEGYKAPSQLRERIALGYFSSFIELQMG